MNQVQLNLTKRSQSMAEIPNQAIIRHTVHVRKNRLYAALKATALRRTTYLPAHKMPATIVREQL
jgi:hypothetical protein